MLKLPEIRHSKLHFHSFTQFFVMALLLGSTFTMIIMPHTYSYVHAAYIKATPSTSGPTINDPRLKAEVVFKGLEIPTSMAFLGPNDILVLEKNKGTVERIVNGKMLPQPLLQIPNIATDEVEWGLLGIAVDKKANDASIPTHIFLYYTEKGNGVKPANHLYRYTLSADGSKLEDPLLLLNLPANSPDPNGESNHDGGKLRIGPDGNVYVVIGDVGGHRGQAQNNPEGVKLDGTSGVLRVTEDGQPVLPNPLGTHDPTKVYYAYGIRNSFGIDFDPISGNLWDTENGPTYGDEINLIQPGFNSGWGQIMGVWHTNGGESGASGAIVVNPGKDLMDFDDKGKYRSPEFVWKQTVGPTALKFMNSDRLGKQYENTMFVGNVNTGDLYNFRLDKDRTSLLLTGPLVGKVVNTPEDLRQVIFGHGFGTITDLEVGPNDGYLYVLTYDGTIYRIVPISG